MSTFRSLKIRSIRHVDGQTELHFFGFPVRFEFSHSWLSSKGIDPYDFRVGRSVGLMGKDGNADTALLGSDRIKEIKIAA